MSGRRPDVVVGGGIAGCAAAAFLAADGARVTLDPVRPGDLP